MTRNPLDFYPTTMSGKILPPALNPLVSIFNLDIQHTILEPCAGNRDMVKALQLNCPDAFLLHSDIIDSLKHTLFTHTDCTKQEYWDQDLLKNNVDLVVTNPPFNQAHLIIPKAFESAKIGCVFLLRLTYLEPTKNRSKWFKDHQHLLRNITPLSPRPRFKTGTNPDTGKPYTADSVTTAWLTFLKPECFQKSLSHLNEYPFFTPLADWNK